LKRPLHPWIWQLEKPESSFENELELFSRLQLIAAAGMVPILAIKYFRYTYKPSKINTPASRTFRWPISSLGKIERQQRVILKDVARVSITQSKNINPVYEPLLSDSPSSRRLLGSGTPFDFFQSQSRLSSIYSRNWKDNWVLGDVHCDKHTFRCHSWTVNPNLVIGGVSALRIVSRS